jgi:hypothetical protein
MIGRIARLALLACTLFGLAAMHTIGHSGMAHAAQPTHQFSTTPALGPSDDCAGDGCVHPAALPGGGGAQMDRWGLCVAVLSAFAIAILLAGLLLTATGRFPLRSGDDRRRSAPRAPPTLPLSLTLATASVLRT